MTIKEAILKSLDDLKGLSTYSEIYNQIEAKNYYDFKVSKTPKATVSALLGDFIRNSDSRVKRIKIKGGNFSYYLTKNESEIDLNLISKKVANETNIKPNSKQRTYQERDLHKLLSSYLKNTQGYSKTIFHEQSKSGRDSNQI